jgi:regulatory protein YycI of two-component signal transduction system YycFG
LTKKYCEIVEKLRDGEDTLELEKQCEVLELGLGDDPSDILYSDKTEKVISYRQKVLEMENDKDDFLYSLAGNKGETMESLSRKTVVELMSFAERLVEEHNKKPNG